MRPTPPLLAACALAALAGLQAVLGAAAAPHHHPGPPAWALLTFAVAAFGERIG